MSRHSFLTLDDLDVQNKTVLVRMDLNVPVHGGRIIDDTRIVRLLPTLRDLIKRRAHIVLLSHFDRPGGTFVPSMTLAPLADALAAALGGHEVGFGVDCIGPAAREAVGRLKPGGVALLENVRFHPGEEKGAAAFARELASLGELYVNDAFSCSHRAHASIVGLAELLPAAAGRLMQQELESLASIFLHPRKPVAAVIGGAKVSTKLALLENLIQSMNVVIIGGAMANTFLYAQDYAMGRSLLEKNLKKTALKILAQAEARGCRIVLPVDMVVAREFKPQAPCIVTGVDAIPRDGIAVDVGPKTVALFAEALGRAKTVLWNGPLGAFETSPFDTATVMLARTVAGMTASKKIRSIAGGGDTVAALGHSGLIDAFTYCSTAGGAFLEWLEGKPLPGVEALYKACMRACA